MCLSCDVFGEKILKYLNLGSGAGAGCSCPPLGSLFCELFSLLPLLLLLLLLPLGSFFCDLFFLLPLICYLLLLPLVLLPVFPVLSYLLCLPCYLFSVHSSLHSQHFSLFYYCLLLPSLSIALFCLLPTFYSLLFPLYTVPYFHWFLPQLLHFFTTSTLYCFLCQLPHLSTALSLCYLLSLPIASSVSLLLPLSTCPSFHYLCSTASSLHCLLALSTVSSLYCLISTQPSPSTALSLHFLLLFPFSHCPYPAVLSHKSTPGARHFNMQPREEFIKRHNAPAAKPKSYVR